MIIVMIQVECLNSTGTGQRSASLIRQTKTVSVFNRKFLKDISVLMPAPFIFFYWSWRRLNYNRLRSTAQDIEYLERPFPVQSRLCGWSYLIYFLIGKLSYSPRSEPSRTVLFFDVMYTTDPHHRSTVNHIHPPCAAPINLFLHGADLFVK